MQQRNFLRGLLICLIPCLLAALFAFRPEKYRLGIDLAGGTILVYEVNLERTRLRKETEQGPQKPDDKEKEKAAAPLEGLTTSELNQLAAQIKRRIDPTDIKNVTVRPSGDRRIEIILPTGGAAGGRANLSREDIEEVKRLISQMGVLEFRIIANGPDDQVGMSEAKRTIEAAAKKDRQWVNPKTGQLEDASELQVRASRGLPPPPPEGEFNVTIGESREMVRYVWVEMGPEYREDMGLSNAYTGQGLWSVLAAERDKAIPLRDRMPTDDIRSATMLVYSRECVNVDVLAQEAERYKRLKAENPSLSEDEIEKLVNRKKVEYFVLTRVSPEDALKVGGDITLTAFPETDPRTGNLCIGFRFNSAGGQLFGKITRRNKPSGGNSRLLAVILDERLVSAATIQSEITTQGQITGKFDKKKVERDVQILRSGALSAELREKPVSENTIGPTLGRDTIRRGTMAIALAFVAVLAFMVVYYRFAGLVACVALFANLLLTVGFMVAVNAAFTLAGLAGLVLTLGIAVDANVLIYERLREERNKGANIATAIRNGYDRAFATIIDTHMTAIFTAIVLYVLGNDNLKGFAISLTVGLVISLFTSLYMTRLIFDYWLHRRWLTELRMLKFFDRTNFKPMKYRFVLFSTTATLTIIGLTLFLIRGEDGLNVDFRGGTVFSATFREGEERGLTSTDGQPGLRELLSDERQKQKLAVKDSPDAVYWANPPTGDIPVNIWRYVITYADNSRATVTLTEKPAGDTPEEMANDVRRRASQLPDVSVEQTYTLDDDPTRGKSRRFTVRTTEKQVSLVRTALDRLMRDDTGRTLLDTNVMTVGPITGSTVTLTFEKPTSLAFTTELFQQEFEKLGEVNADTFTLTGVDEKIDGRHKVLKLDVSRNPTLDKLNDPNHPRHAEQLKALQSVLDEAKRAFDSTPEPERLEVFDSQLAAETRTKAFYAILASWGAILLYLWLRFGNWTFGLAAVLCLIHDLSFALGAVAVCHYLYLIPGFDYLGIQDFKIDLAAVAALLTLVGYSVSDTIVVFDRIREVRGKNPRLTPEMINDSINQTLGRTILTSTTVFLVSIVLYAFGGDGVHLFSFIMVVGVLVGTYSSIFVAAPLLLFFGEGHEPAALAETPVGTQPQEREEEQVVEG